MSGAELLEREVSGLAGKRPSDGFDRNIAGFACQGVAGGEHHTDASRIEITVKRFREIESADGAIDFGCSRCHHNLKCAARNPHSDEFTDVSPELGPRED